MTRKQIVIACSFCAAILVQQTQLFAQALASPVQSVRVIRSQNNGAIQTLIVPSNPAASAMMQQMSGSLLGAPTALRTAQSTQPDPQEKERLAKITKLEFDRRPSVILKEWSTVPKTAEQLQAEKEKRAKEAKKKTLAALGDPPPPAMPDTRTEAQRQTAAAAARTKADAARKKADLAARLAKFDKQLTKLKRHVTLGEWPEVAGFLKSVTETQAKAVYQQMLTSLATGPKAARPTHAEKNRFNHDDVVALAMLAPSELKANQTSLIGSILRQSISQGNSVESAIEKLKNVLTANKDNKDARVSKRVVARLLFSAGKPVEAGAFLPSQEDAIKEDDREALNLLAQHFVSMHSKENTAEYLEKAWNATQAALAAGEIEEAAKQAALQQAVRLAPKVKEEFGQAWLDESFTKRPKRGKEILAAIGSAVSTGFQYHMRDVPFRQQALELQKTAVDALLQATADDSAKWADTLNLLALNWLREADWSRRYDNSSSYGPSMRRDTFGNLYYTGTSYSYSSNRNQPQPIASDKVLDAGPDDKWLALIAAPLKPKFATVIPQLYLKMKEEKKAFPYIEELAKTHPKQAKDLAEEFLRVWTTNHNPNTQRSYTNYYMFSYGFNQRANGIPLTRSRQERNLKDLAGWFARLRALPIEELDENLLAKAFTNCHGTAEVYRLEELESVFGSLENIKPKTLATLLQGMRANLAGLWRVPAVQQQNKTNRKKKDIQREVLKGYEVANGVLTKAIEKHPQEWSLQLAKAAFLHDENNYKAELARSSEFSGKREQSFAEFEKAAALYASSVKDLKPEEEKTDVFETWFYASMGACDLGQITNEQQPDHRQPALIKKAIQELPGEAAKRHMDSFANALFTRLSSVKPGVKYSFLRNGFKIVDDNEQAKEARKVYEYYSDLVTEIQLETKIDGSANVGHSEPFGVFVNIRHTQAIERESGGFSKYLQNQNNMYYSYNYGRPTENYREKFEEMVTQALSEQFEVLSVTFQADSVNSRATAEYGWRITPYAYLLLKPRGAEVDKVSPLKLEFDFMDTSGYAVLPVESANLPIDASAKTGDPRPIENLKITQTLDERQAKDGKLILEVKASGQGLVPALDDIIELAPEGFEVAEVEDEGVSVSQFDKESEDNVVTSERMWTLTMQAKDDNTALPEAFTFGKPTVDTAEVEWQRFVDADLASVEQTIALEYDYGDTKAPIETWIVVGIIGLCLIAVLTSLAFMPKTAETKVARFQMPEEVTPFTVLGLLRDIERNNGLAPKRREELHTNINRLEEHFFANKGDVPDLEELAARWVRESK